MSQRTDIELVITRTFDAPPDVVWKAWTEPEQVSQWLGPTGFTCTDHRLDPHPGGMWRTSMRSPEGQDYSNHGTVREVVEQERLVFTFAWDDSPHEEMLVTITFAAHGSRTEMVFHQTGFPSLESRDGHNEGWSESFDKLAEYLAKRLP